MYLRTFPLYYEIKFFPKKLADEVKIQQNTAKSYFFLIKR